MSKKDKLLKKAKDSPGNLTFRELCVLAEQTGFMLRKNASGHVIYKHPSIQKMINFQPDKRNKSKAKKYQIKQLIALIDDFKLTED